MEVATKLSGLGAEEASLERVPGSVALHSSGHFSGGPQIPIRESAVHTLRETYGLPVALIAELSGVSRRTVHNWLNDSNVRPANRARLDLVTSVAERLPADGRPLASRLDDAAGSASFRTLFKANEVAGVERKLARVVALSGRVPVPMAPMQPLRREVFEDDVPEDDQVSYEVPAFGKVLGIVKADGATPLARA